MTTRRTFLELSALAVAATNTVALADTAPGYTLPALPYAYDALEPYIDAQTMQLHHDKHHQAYVTNLNKAVGGDPALSKLTVDQLMRQLNTLPEGVRSQVRNQGGGHSNHSLFWQTLAPAAKSGKPSGKLLTAIETTFGGQDKMEDKLKASAMSVFGSGWSWLVTDSSGKLSLETTPNQDSPLTAGKYPLFGIDVWEHAYYLKYQNRRAEYVAAILHVVNWEFVSDRYQHLPA